MHSWHLQGGISWTSSIFDPFTKLPCTDSATILKRSTTKYSFSSSPFQYRNWISSPIAAVHPS